MCSEFSQPRANPRTLSEPTKPRSHQRTNSAPQKPGYSGNTGSQRRHGGGTGRSVSITPPDPIALRQFRPHDRLGNVQEDKPPPNLQGGRGTTTSEPQPRSPMSVTPQVSGPRGLRDGGAPSQQMNGAFPPGKREHLRSAKSDFLLIFAGGISSRLNTSQTILADRRPLNSTHSPSGTRGTTCICGQSCPVKSLSVRGNRRRV